MRNRWAIAGVILTLTLLFCVFLDDAMGILTIRESTYTTPWYDARWWKQPVTHIMLSFYRDEDKLATNAVGDLWLVREIQVGDKTYWTRLKVLKKH